jgi:16S rRNA (guanine(966)-N(2))-methyltransferase RsmD
MCRVSRIKHSMKPFTRPSSTKDKPAPAHKGAGEVRIIGGQWRRTKLPVANKSGLRPTPDRVRETLFNWLGQSLLGWKCADIFPGTGALGLEAASREASVVQLCEQDAVLVGQLTSAYRSPTSICRTCSANRWSFLACQTSTPKFGSCASVDPPFESHLFEPALKAATPKHQARCLDLFGSAQKMG